MEDSLGGSSIALGVVEDAVADTVRGEGRGRMFVLIGRERELASHTTVIENQCVWGYLRNSGKAQVCQVLIDEVLDALISWWKDSRQQPVFLPETLQHVRGQLHKSGSFFGIYRKAQTFQLDIYIRNKAGSLLWRGSVQA
ncbi:MAG: hypothetical protein BWX44_00732 [Spirochaetes bacterium ADurb.Bin001]|nr:MAG: hypothetical protein BWX44_00732 [Spirochaetes bacterium ADurb.Bin001]